MSKVNPAVIDYASKDFAKVPSRLSADQPQVLVHRNVWSTELQGDVAFSKERKHLVRVIDLPSRVLSMTLGGLESGQSTNRHRHNYETIIYVLSGYGYSMVDDHRIEWAAGDAFYVPVWSWHKHTNLSETGPARYVACENAPMLQNLGIALREEA